MIRERPPVDVVTSRRTKGTEIAACLGLKNSEVIGNEDAAPVEEYVVVRAEDKYVGGNVGPVVRSAERPDVSAFGVLTPRGSSARRHTLGGGVPAPVEKPGGRLPVATIIGGP